MSVKRLCDKCGSTLAGRRRHGFVQRNGKSVWCSLCTNPKKKREE